MLAKSKRSQNNLIGQLKNEKHFTHKKPRPHPFIHLLPFICLCFNLVEKAPEKSLATAFFSKLKPSFERWSFVNVPSMPGLCCHISWRRSVFVLCFVHKIKSLPCVKRSKIISLFYLISCLFFQNENILFKNWSMFLRLKRPRILGTQ